MEISSAYAGSARSISIRPEYEPPQDRKAPAQERSGQLDPASLARIALEEELKKRGGGGGGGPRYNPLTWVPYSFKLLGEAIEKMRQAFEAALNQGMGDAPSEFLSSVREAGEATGNLIRTVAVPMTRGVASTMKLSSNFISSMFKDPLGTSAKMLRQVSFIGQVIASAIASGLKKVFYGKDEEKIDSEEDYEEEGNYFDKIFADLGAKDFQNQNNNNGFAGHLQNLALQLTKALKKLSLRP